MMVQKLPSNLLSWRKKKLNSYPKTKLSKNETTLVQIRMKDTRGRASKTALRGRAL
jgi:hypothetical protein